MKWLISYQYRVTTGSRVLGVSRGGELQDGIELTDMHPAAWLADKLAQVDRLVSDEGAQYSCVYEPTRIYSAIEVPDGTLTPDEVAWLS